MVNTGVAPCVPETSVIRGSQSVRPAHLDTERTDVRDERETSQREQRTVRSRRATRGGRRGPRRPRGATAHADRLNLQNVPLGSELCPSLPRLRTPTSDVQRVCASTHIPKSVSCLRFNITQSARV